MTGMEQFTFRFDQARCTGCKACQIACKDDNDLPVGATWRRVYESSGGRWQGDASTLSPEGMFTYYTSMSCNHCSDPICVSVCPSTAMHKGALGLVTVDADICIGCGYCAMACPYQAPQFRPDLGIMTKCDGCLDRLVTGDAPACVSACPTRALGFELVERLNPLPPRLEPLPDPELTRPNLVLEPHPAALRAGSEATATAPRQEPGLLHEFPLVIFTVLAQTAAGLATAVALTVGVALAIDWWLGSLPLLGAVVAGVALGLALIASTSHLGRPGRAPNALRNLNSSPLSREIAAAAVFGVALVAQCAALLGVPVARQLSVGLALVAGIAGVILIAAIARVYTLRTVPAWNSIHTSIAFFGTAVTVGFSLCAWLVPFAVDGVPAAAVQRPLYLVSLLSVCVGVLGRRSHRAALARGRSDAARLSFRILSTSHPRLQSLGRLTGALGTVCVLGAAVAGSSWPLAAGGLGVVGVGLLATHEVIGRLFFYRSMIRDGR